MYFAKVNWYNDYDEKDVISCMIICANGWNEAMEKISKQFTWINSIQMDQLDSDECDVVYITEDMLDGILKENSY